MINHYSYNYCYFYYYHYFASLSIKEGGLKTFRQKNEILELPGNGEIRANSTL